MLHINNAAIAYDGRRIFSGFHLHLSAGEMACISGPSGCGKSSLLHAVLGFIPLEEGNITINGICMGKGSVDQVRRQIAWIPQELALPIEWVREMVQLPFGLKANRGTPFSKEVLYDHFEALGLEREVYEKRVGEISGGQRQRIMIAVAAMMHKPLIVVDEPTSALDADSTARVLAFFHQQACRGTTLLAVSHDKNFANGCDQHIIMTS